jgi:hypothetical protein
LCIFIRKKFKLSIKNGVKSHDLRVEPDRDYPVINLNAVAFSGACKFLVLAGCSRRSKLASS